MSAEALLEDSKPSGAQGFESPSFRLSSLATRWHLTHVGTDGALGKRPRAAEIALQIRVACPPAAASI